MRSAVTNYLGMIAIAIVVALVFGALAIRIDRSQEPDLPPGTSATPAISGNSPDMLVDARWLLQYQNQVDYVFDLSDMRLYNQGHIPGARHVYVQDAMMLHPANYGEPAPISTDGSVDVFGYLNLNVPQNSRIVLYDANGSERASWLLWVMKINGYTDVHVLDGGLAAWIGAGGDTSTEIPPVLETLLGTPVWDEQFLIRQGPLYESLDNPNVMLVDTRSDEEQRDTVNGTVREGHIPGSINIPTEEVMRSDGTFRSVEELQDIFTSHGLDPDATIVVYGLFTTQASNVWLALHLAGYDNVVIYQEGFVAWAFDTTMPISTDPYPATQPVGTPVALPDSPFPTPDDGPTDLTGDPDRGMSTPGA